MSTQSVNSIWFVPHGSVAEVQMPVGVGRSGDYGKYKAAAARNGDKL